jgi:hypothetical protein
MQCVMPTPQWHMVRHLHVSTMFLTPRQYWPAGTNFPPDNYEHWAEGCRALKRLRGLRSLCVEMIVGDMHHRQDATTVDDDSLVAVLEPPNRVTAPWFELEINLAVNKRVRERLGDMAFIIVVKSRPYNTVLFP